MKMANFFFFFFYFCMRIMFDNTPFGARNKRIRKADDIQRNAKLVFPIVSTTYHDVFYISCSNKNSKNYKRASKISNDINKKLEKKRKNNDIKKCFAIIKKSFFKKAQHPLMVELDSLKKTKLGNCGENAFLAYATLLANGYFNSDLVELFYSVKLEDPATKGGVKVNRDLDHSFVITDMNSKDEKQEIIVDPWLGFAGSKTDAAERFSILWDDDDITETHALAIEVLGESTTEDEQKYNVTEQFEYRKCADLALSQEEKEKLALAVRKKFPELVLKNNLKKE